MEFHSGDHVGWRTASGCVLRKATCKLAVGPRTFEASPEEPRFLIRRDKDGELVAIKPDALRLLPN